MNAAFAMNHCPSGSAGATNGGGPPTVADFNGDGIPDVGLAGGIAYVVFDGSKLMDSTVAGPQTILWSVTTTDCSSAATGSSVFDFQGNGKAEAVYSDEDYLRIYNGTTGNVVFQTCNTTGTLIEYPVIADIDNDGHADIVVVSNAYASSNAEYQCNDGTHIAQAGVQVFNDAEQHLGADAAGVERARLPRDQRDPRRDHPAATRRRTPSRWASTTSARTSNRSSEFAAPDRVLSVASLCPGPTAPGRDRAQHRAGGDPRRREHRLPEGATRRACCSATRRRRSSSTRPRHRT